MCVSKQLKSVFGPITFGDTRIGVLQLWYLVCGSLVLKRFIEYNEQVNSKSVFACFQFDDFEYNT